MITNIIYSMFFDRHEAGKSLAMKLRQYKNRNVVLYALPKGGVPVAYEVAKALDLPLDIVIANKINHPVSDEYGICAVNEYGWQVKDECGLCGLDTEWFEYKVQQELLEAGRQRLVYKHGQESLSAENKIAIIVDDGIATGLTVKAAVQTIADQWPEEIIIATPVAPRNVVSDLKTVADTVIVDLADPQYRGKVSFYYHDFKEVSDNEVVRLLTLANQRAITGLPYIQTIHNYASRF